MNFRFLYFLIFWFSAKLLIANQSIGHFNSRIIKNEVEYFSVQVASHPISEKEEALQLLSKMKERGYFVFLTTYRPENSKEIYIRIRTGYFPKYAEAKRHCIKLQKDGFEYYIDKQKFIVASKGNMRIIKTPNSIWLFDENNFKELFDITPSLFDRNIDFYYTQPFISPKGDEVLFEYDGKIIKINLNTNEKLIIENHVSNSFPQKSPSGKYIAYINDNLWESESSLWIHNSETSFCLVDVNESKKQDAIKNFVWHPTEDIIFYIIGSAYGTLTVGGEIWAVDITGKKCSLISCATNNREEIVNEFFIENNSLKYKIAQFDDGYTQISKLIEKKMRLDKLLSEFYNKTK